MPLFNLSTLDWNENKTLKLYFICLLPYNIQDFNTFHWVIGILPGSHRVLSDAKKQFSKSNCISEFIKPSTLRIAAPMATW